MVFRYRKKFRSRRRYRRRRSFPSKKRRYNSTAMRIGKRKLFKARRRLTELKYLGAVGGPTADMWRPTLGPIFLYNVHAPAQGTARFERIGAMTQVKYVYAKLDIAPIINLAVTEPPRDWIRYDFYLILIKEPNAADTPASILSSTFLGPTVGQPPRLWTRNPDYSTNYLLLRHRTITYTPAIWQRYDNTAVNPTRAANCEGYDYINSFKPRTITMFKKFGRRGIPVEQIGGATDVLRNRIVVIIYASSRTGVDPQFSLNQTIKMTSRFTDS